MRCTWKFQWQKMRRGSPSFPLPQDAFRKVADGDKNAMKNELKKENQQVQDAYLMTGRLEMWEKFLNNLSMSHRY